VRTCLLGHNSLAQCGYNIATYIGTNSTQFTVKLKNQQLTLNKLSNSCCGQLTMITSPITVTVSTNLANLTQFNLAHLK